MTLDEIWAVVEPYAETILTFLMSGGVGAFLGNFLAKSVTNKINVDSITTSVANKLTGSSINIDLSAITEKKLTEITASTDTQLGEIKGGINEVLTCLVDVITCITNSAKLKEEEVEQLTADIDAIKATITPIESTETITLNIASTDVAEETENTSGAVLQ